MNALIIMHARSDGKIREGGRGWEGRERERERGGYHHSVHYVHACGRLLPVAH